MLGKLFGRGNRHGPSAPFYRPYGDKTADFLYNLLFCDNPDLFRNGEQDESALATVLSGAATHEALEMIAVDPDIESRVRMLAFNRLRAMGLPIPAKQLLGTIIEFPQRGGLDTLAAFADGRVRYINQTGHPAIFEFAPAASRLEGERADAGFAACRRPARPVGRAAAPAAIRRSDTLEFPGVRWALFRRRELRRLGRRSRSRAGVDGGRRAAGAIGR